MKFYDVRWAMYQHMCRSARKIDNRARRRFRLIGAPNIEYWIPGTHEPTRRVKSKVQRGVVGRIDARERTKIKCWRFGRDRGFLKRPLQCGDVRKVAVRTAAVPLSQERGKGRADVVQIAGARRVGGLELTSKPLEIIATDKALDDGKFERQCPCKACMQLIAVDSDPRASADATGADVCADRLVCLIKECRGEALLQLTQRRHGAPATLDRFSLLR